MAEESPIVIVLGGINGAGKTTASRTLLADTLDRMTFVNADMIAQGLNAFDPESVAIPAGRIMLDRLKQLAEERASFAFETTLAARTYAGWLDSLRQNGYTVQLVYFWVGTPDLAVSRVALRVSQGGHHVPEETIRQRYRRSLMNFFQLYRPVVTTWDVYETIQPGAPRLIASGAATGLVTVADEAAWKLIQEQAQ